MLNHQLYRTLKLKKGEEYTLEQAFDSLIVQVNLIEQILIMKSKHL